MENRDRIENKNPKLPLPWYAIALATMMLMMFAANAAMVWFSSHGTHDLVRSDYYDAGLLQDKVIARISLAKSAGMEAPINFGKDVWTIKTGAKSLKNSTCRIYLYRPENEKEDQVIELESMNLTESDSTVWQHPGLNLRKGKWIAKVVWEKNKIAIMEKSYQLTF